MYRKQQGFTLVEIAIVLVIIGLLLGGVLKGQELINSAKVKNLINDFRSIPTFVYGYQDKFKRLPGDDPAAANHLGAAAVNGDGDGQIEGAWNAYPAGAAVVCAAGAESCNFWVHVRMANLAAGPTVPNSGDFIPLNAEGGPVGITSVAPVAGWTGNFFVCSGNIQGRFARQIDTTIDDGTTNTGTIRVVNEAAAPAAFVALTPANDATLYTVCSSF